MTAATPHRSRVLVLPIACAIALSCPMATAVAGPWVWDSSDNRVDDRIESVHVGGYHFSFEQADSLLRQRISVIRASGILFYDIYVVYDHDPTSGDIAFLWSIGAPTLHRYRNVPALRSVATFTQVTQIAAQAGVERVEAVPVLYPMDVVGGASIGVRDPSRHVFPTLAEVGAPAGEGIIVAILDSGINDALRGSFPGHESLRGKCVGGGVFFGSDSSLDTPRDGTTNPVDQGGESTRSHGTHVAGIILGTGGASGYVAGVAPGARFVDLKVLNDAGIGTGVPEALDWCIHNRSRNWGVGPGLEGIDVINLSISSLDLSDGRDVASRLAQRAVSLGIAVVASAGNESETGYVPSPAAGDDVLAIGAVDDQRTPLDHDDVFASFSDLGPRTSDQDQDLTDEQKPELVAPGIAVLSADGDLSSNGGQYRRLSGTSMATAYVSGAVAVLRAAFPAMSPGDVTQILTATARRTVVGPPGAAGPDPRWSAATGFGAVDLYAAWLEATQASSSQVRRLTLSATETAVTARLWTQREMGAAHYVFERAADTGDAPGAFAALDSVAATGDGSLLDPVNLQAYERTWNVPESEHGATYWYRVSYTENGVRHDSQALPFQNPLGPSAATIEVTIVHNAYDSDVDGEIQTGLGAGPTIPNYRGPAALTFPLPATSSAVSSDWTEGAAISGNITWTFRIPVPMGQAESYLPPSNSHPWWLTVREDGIADRSGRVSAFRLIWHNNPDMTFEGGPTPQQTMETQGTYASIPMGLVGVGSPGIAPAIRIGPNPVSGGETVHMAFGGRWEGDLTVHDLAGRQVGRTPLFAAADGAFARWAARESNGRALGSGVYFARVGARTVGRIVVLAR